MAWHVELWTSPVGVIGLVAGEKGLRMMLIHADPAIVQESLFESFPDATPGGDDPQLIQAMSQLDAYFRGVRKHFDLLLDFSALSPFSEYVLRALQTVDYGRTLSYGELAVMAGHPGAARAVGRVMAANPFPIVIPCHRVIGRSGALTGYSGGQGLATKQKLLLLERAIGDAIQDLGTEEQGHLFAQD